MNEGEKRMEGIEEKKERTQKTQIYFKLYSDWPNE